MGEIAPCASARPPTDFFNTIHPSRMFGLPVVFST